jgi:protein involved in polysaccharide export with SLBB domain
LAEFETAGPSSPAVDMDRLVKAKIARGSYRVVPDEVLELTMPTILQIVTASEPAYSDRIAPIAPYVCRVSETGTITLPVVGEIKAAGKTLAEIESAVINAYYPKYAVTRPSVFARVLEYKTAKVSITGAVQKPGIYSLRSDQMSLVSLVMEAGGIVDEGAALIRINHTDETMPAETIEAEPDEPTEEKIKETMKEMLGEISEQEKIKERAATIPNQNKQIEPIILPVKGLNIPFADVAVNEGDSVVVERLTMPMFTVIGLVEKPGNVPYPPDVEYNLMQAIAFAGGLDIAADPRYATIYRLKADGTILRAPFQIIDSRKGSKLTESLSVPIKPGDIVAIEHTPRTRTNVFVDKMFRTSIGAYINMSDFWVGQ